MSGGYIGGSGLWGHKETGYASFLAAMGKCGRRLRYGGTVVHAVEHRIHAGQIKGTVVYARVGRDLQNAAPVERRGLDRHKGHRSVVAQAGCSPS